MSGILPLVFLMGELLRSSGLSHLSLRLRTLDTVLGNVLVLDTRSMIQSGPQGLGVKSCLATSLHSPPFHTKHSADLRLLHFWVLDVPLAHATTVIIRECFPRLRGDRWHKRSGRFQRLNSHGHRRYRHWGRRVEAAWVRQHTRPRGIGRHHQHGQRWVMRGWGRSRVVVM